MSEVLFHFLSRIPCPSSYAKGVGVLLVSVLTVSVASAERQPFERYQSVVDRQMFGPPPEGFDPTKPPSEAVTSRAQQKADAELSKEQEKLKSAIRFSMINVTPSGETAVGFTDSSDSKSPRNYYLKVGESAGNWTVKEADPAQSSMTIVNTEGVEVSLSIGGDSAKGAGKTAAAGGQPVAADRRRNLVTAPGMGSLRARREQRRAAETARMEEFNRQMQEREAALEKRAQEDAAQREAEKAEREAEREAQRKQLLQIQEELKKSREEKEKAKEQEKEQSDKSDSDDSQS